MARYTPGNMQDKSLSDELEKIAQAMDTANSMLNLDMLYAAPKKFRVGSMVLADGAVWNPGAGEGVYVYRTGGWKLLG